MKRAESIWMTEPLNPTFISRKGATNIVIFEGIMDSNAFIEIIRNNILPFIKETGRPL
jgi:hypothetical protein